MDGLRQSCYFAVGRFYLRLLHVQGQSHYSGYVDQAAPWWSQSANCEGDGCGGTSDLGGSGLGPELEKKFGSVHLSHKKPMLLQV